MPGDLADGHEVLVQRLLRTKIPTLAARRDGAQRGAIWETIIETEGSLPYRNLKAFQELLARHLYDKADKGHREEDRTSGIALLKHEQWQLHSFVVLQHDISVAKLGDDLPEFIKWCTHDFWKTKWLSGPQFLIFLNLRSAEPAPSPWWSWKRPVEQKPLEAHLNALFGEKNDELPGGCPCRRLSRLGEISVGHVADWLLDNKIVDSHSAAKEQAPKLYEKAETRAKARKTSVRMDHIKPVLADFLKDPTTPLT